MTLDPNFPKLVLDPGNETELTQLAYARIASASGNTINDFRAGSTVAAFVEGQTFALAELLYYLNLMPEALAIEVFRLYGVKRSLGTRASGALTVLLESETTNGFTLPTGYAIPYLDTNLVLQSPLVINAGGREGTVPVLCDKVGSAYNAKPFDILATSTGLALVQTIFNRDALTGGSNLEPLDLLIPRCQAATVARNAVITKLDYETAAQSLLGVGSRAVAVPNVSSDGFSFLRSAVALFLLDSNGTPANPTNCNTVQTTLRPNILLGTSLACFPAVLVPLSIEVFLNVRSISEVIGNTLVAEVDRYLDPVLYTGGMMVKHLEIAHVCRQVPTVTAVDSVIVNGVAQDYLLAQSWYYPYAESVVVNMIDPSGLTLTVVGGRGDGDNSE